MRKFRDFKFFILTEADEEIPEKPVKQDFEKKYFRDKKEVTELDDNITKVVALLKKQRASKASRLIDQYAKMLQEKKRLDQEIDQIKEKQYPLFQELFNVQEAIYTRVIETASMILTMDKETTVHRKNFDEEGFFKELEQIVAPSIFALLIELRKKFTEETEEIRKSRLTPKLKNEGPMSDLMAKIKAFSKNVFLKLRRVDDVLDKWKEKLGMEK